MDPIVPADKQPIVPATVVPPVDTTEQDPLKLDLEKQKRIRKLTYTRDRVDEQLRELGVELPEAPEDEDDNKPLTKGEFKKISAAEAQKTSLQLAEAIQNESERELVKFHLQHTIRSTGNAAQDLELAQGLANAARNRQILEEQNRKPNSSARSTGSGAPPKELAPDQEFTAEEQKMMVAPFNLTKQQVLDARAGKSFAFSKK